MLVSTGALVRSKRMRFAAATVALGVACSHVPPPPMHAERLTVERSENGNVRAYVHVLVDGEPLTMLVDTGAASSVLPSRFAERHHSGQKSDNTDEYYIDANGDRQWTVHASNVPVQFEGEKTAGLMNFIVVPSVNISEGLIALQDIVRPGTVLIIDIAREEIRAEEEQAALARLRADSTTPLREVDFRRCLEEGFLDRHHRSVRATINGVSTRMIVDTGASRTTMARNNSALRSMLERKGNIGKTFGVTSIGRTLLIEDVPLEFAGASFVLPMLVEPASMSCGEGLIGADVLSRCTLVWGWSNLWMACKP